MLSVKQGGIKYHFFFFLFFFRVFGMTFSGIEPLSLRPLKNTQTIMPMDYIYANCVLSHTRNAFFFNCEKNHSASCIQRLIIIDYNFTSDSHFYLSWLHNIIIYSLLIIQSLFLINVFSCNVLFL